MPVADIKPVISRISDVVFARLQRLTASTGGAYTFRNVVRPTKLATYTPEHGTIVLTRGEVSRVNELDCPGNPPAMAWQQVFLIRVHIAPSEKDTTPVEVYEDIAETKIHWVLTNCDQWHTFDGHAINADFGPQQTAVSDGGYDGIAIPLIVTYRVTEGDLTEVRA